MEISAQLDNSPIQHVKIAGHPIYIKRDDLLNTHFSGNKARKFAYYLQNNLEKNQSLSKITHLVSYGSIQANSLYSLAALAHIKGWQLHYYVSRVPQWLKGSTLGNYGQAIALGAKIIEWNEEFNPDQNLDSAMQNFAATLPESSLFIPEGGRSHLAEHGINQLAQEIAQYCQDNHLFEQHGKAQIMLPSGTGTTALFLQKWFKENGCPIKVLTCACVGDSTYLKQQFNELNPNKAQWPTILPTNKTYHFGKLYKNHYQLWQQIQQESGIEFELLYDPIGWQCLLEYLSKNDHKNTLNDVATPTFYIHQGGLMGNQTMLPRYKRKYPNLE